MAILRKSNNIVTAILKSQGIVSDKVLDVKINLAINTTASISVTYQLDNENDKLIDAISAYKMLLQPIYITNKCLPLHRQIQLLRKNRVKCIIALCVVAVYGYLLIMA